MDWLSLIAVTAVFIILWGLVLLNIQEVMLLMRTSMKQADRSRRDQELKSLRSLIIVESMVAAAFSAAAYIMISRSLTC